MINHALQDLVIEQEALFHEKSWKQVEENAYNTLAIFTKRNKKTSKQSTK
jgi:hypothetical protein